MIPEAAVNEETIKQVREVSDAIHKIGQAFVRAHASRQVIPEAAACELTPGCIKVNGHDSECTVLK